MPNEQEIPLMKQKTKRILTWIFGIIAFFIVAIPTALILWIYIDNRLIYKTYYEARDELAMLWGVELETLDVSFPYEYLNTLLNTDSSISDVHAIMTDYEKVLNCRNVSEIYYFASLDDDDALRIKIVYDEEKNFRFIRSEDINSSLFLTEGCWPGLISED